MNDKILAKDDETMAKIEENQSAKEIEKIIEEAGKVQMSYDEMDDKIDYALDMESHNN